MSIIRSTLAQLAEILSVRSDQVEDALASEKLVKRTISRRGMFRAASVAVAAAALPSGLVMSEVARHSNPFFDALPEPQPLNSWAAFSSTDWQWVMLVPSTSALAYKIRSAPTRPRPLR